ncbi:SspB family protein [Nitratireductor sp. ZSWI3]|uniref:SspB family protein n=1 Tax=Nitratireductor sp. ZSWI3 TaxID=2966359 RepID=UPI00214FE28C|nr:SspB family protein [Nitratireductor sp. ZSWI3]MCR4267122.1 SspB family protein [Nitratireductor sp. ZSWI3]
MAEDRIRYDILAQDALRGVMRKVLAEVARTGLPGEHHFFITFLTTAPGVRISTRLRERYPEQMTIVLQYQYWDLKVSETGFEVGLSFADVPEMLSIPFSAVRGFYDPSVNFELEFDVRPEEAAVAANTETAGEAVRPVDAAPEPQTKKPSEPAKKKSAKSAPKEKEKEKEKQESKGAEVVSLDAFRKK